MVCWSLDIVLPVITFVYRLGLDRMVMTLISLILIVISFVFCRWRYNRSRRDVYSATVSLRTSWPSSAVDLGCHCGDCRHRSCSHDVWRTMGEWKCVVRLFLASSRY